MALGYLASAIRHKTDWDVLVYNADFNLGPTNSVFENSYFTGAGFTEYRINLSDASRPIWKEFFLVISEYRPSVVGISVKSQSFAATCMMAKIAKTLDANIKVIIGGPHPTMVSKKVLNCPDIDIAVKGEGEETIVELLDAIALDRNKGHIKGIIYRDNGEIKETAAREFIKDLDSLSPPYENLQNVLKDYDRYPIQAFRCIMTARGCPHRCIFCGSHMIWSRQVRCRSAENIIKEIKYLKSKGVKYFQFVDDSFGPSKSRVKELCNAFIENHLDILWTCEFNVQLVEEDTISLMKKAGCNALKIGIESGDDEILKKIQKDITVAQVRSACRIIKKYDLQLQTCFLFGFPWDTEATMNNSVSLIKEINSDIIVYSIFTPHPGTAAFEYCKQQGLIDEDADWSLYYHQSPKNHFCFNLSQKKFRKILRKAEIMIDRINCPKPSLLERLKHTRFFNSIKKARTFGLRQFLKKAAQILRGG